MKLMLLHDNHVGRAIKLMLNCLTQIIIMPMTSAVIAITASAHERVAFECISSLHVCLW